MLGLFAFSSLIAQSENSTLQSLSTAEKIESPQFLDDNTFYYLFSVNYRHKTLETLIEYIEEVGYKVIATCDTENMIYIKTSEKFKRHIDLFELIEKKFLGFDAICKLEMNENSIAVFNTCNDAGITAKLNN